MATLDEKPAKVEPKSTPEIEPEASVEGWVILITGIHEEASEDDIYDRFVEFGEIQNMKMELDRLTGYVKGYSFIEYKSKEEAQAAIDAENGSKMYEKAIQVDWAVQKRASPQE